MNLGDNVERGHTPRIVILISGSGSNMAAIADAVKAGNIDAEIAAVISNRPDAAGLQKAKDRDLPTAVLNHKDYASRESFDRALAALINEYEPDLVVLAGFMRILTPEFVEQFHGRMLNIHPSLLPKFQGLNTHQRAIDAGETEHGVTVHFVTAELDGGPSVIQAVVNINADDTAQSLQQRVQVQEHIIYPIAVKWFAEGRLLLHSDGSIRLDGHPIPKQGARLPA